MLRRFQPVLVVGGLSVVSFYLGDRLESWLLSGQREQAADARPLTRKAPKVAAASVYRPPGVSALRPGIVPVLPSDQALPATPQQAALPPAQEASGQPSAAASPLTPPASTAASDSEAKVVTVRGKDPDTDADYVELRNLPVAEGEAVDQRPARDVDMIDGPPQPADDAPAPSTEPADQATN